MPQLNDDELKQIRNLLCVITPQIITFITKLVEIEKIEKQIEILGIEHGKQVAFIDTKTNNDKLRENQLDMKWITDMGKLKEDISKIKKELKNNL